MLDFFSKLFSSDFMPHGHCYQWLPEILWLHVISDGLIALSYATIPVTLTVFVMKRKDLAFRWIFVLFGLFILCCGATHALEVWTAWYGTYRLTGVTKAVTAGVSLSTAVALIPLIPKALRLPSPRQLEEANLRLERESAERLEAELALAERAGEEVFRAVFEAAPNGMILTGSDGRITFANTAAEQIFEYEPDTMKGLPLRELFHARDRAEAGILDEAFFSSEIEGWRHTVTEIEGVTRKDERRDLELGLEPIAYHDQPHLLASIVDITERKRAQRDLAATRARFDRAVRGSHDGYWEWDLRTRKTWHSPRLKELLGFEAGRVDHSIAWWLAHIHPADLDRVDGALQEHIEHGKTLNLEYRMRLADDVYRWFQIKGEAVRDEQGTAISMSGSLADVHDRKLAETELAESKDFLESIFYGIEHGIFVVDVEEEGDYRFASFNPAEERLTGIPVAEAVGKTIEDLVPKHLPEEAARQVRGNYDRCLTARERVQYIEMLPLQGRETWWMTNLMPLFDENQRIYRIIGSATEITELKRIERERERFAKRLQASNQELEEFAFVASHDLREPLRKVMSFGRLIESRFAEDVPEKARDYLTRMVGATERMDRLVNDLLTYSRITRSERERTPVRLGETVETVVSDMETLIGEQDAVVHIGTLPEIVADPSQIYQLFQNLIGNAIKYRHPERAPHVTIGGEVADNEARIHVRDNGIGFPSEQAKRIFKIFQRLHGRGVYEGSGIGLAVCKKIMSQHNGKITTESKPGEGSVFTVIFPRAQKGEADA